MIPAQFDYVRAGSVDEAVAALAEHGDDAKVLAGGQSLIPLLRLRLAYPEVVVDVGRVDEMRGVREDGDHLVIGAMTTHYDVIHDPLVQAHARSDRRRRPRRSPTRRYGTAAPSAARSRTPTRPATCRRWRWRWTPSSSSRAPAAGVRSPASDFFVDYLQTALAPGRGARRGPGAQARRRLGLPLREVPPGRAGVGDRRRRRRGAPGQRLDRRGAGRR